MGHQRLAYTYAAIAVCFWATVASAFKISLRSVDFLQLLFYASIVSILVLFITLILQGKLHLLKSCSKKEYFHSMLLGFLNPFLYYIVLFKAYSILPAQEAVPLNYTWPLIIALLSIPLLKQKIKFKSILAILISFIGVVVISTQGDILGFRFSNPAGAVLALGSAVIWALFWIFNIRDPRDEVVKLFLNFIFGFIFILPVVSFFSEIVLPDITGILGVTYVGLFEMGITFVLWLKALKFSRTTAQVSNCIYVVPFLSLIVIYFAVGEKILTSTIIGLIFIVAGIVLQQLHGRRRPRF